MADNLLLPTSINQMTDSDSLVFVAAVYVYDAGTTDLKNVYTDATLSTAAANPIIADGDGVLPARYIGTGSYKLVIKDTEGYPTEELSSHWTTFKTIDNLPGAPDTSSYSNDKAISITPVISKASDYPVISTDQGKIIDVDPTGGNVTITLPSAITVGDNWRITVKHHGSANSITVATTGSQTIDDEETFVLDNQYESATFVSDGANWLVSETGRRVELVVLPRGYISGGELSNGSDATNDINVAAGVVRDYTDTVNITIPALTKQLDANWVAGTNAGMRNSAAGIDNTTYFIYAASKADGTSDIYAHTSATFATVLTALQAETGGADYLYLADLGAILRESGAIVGFVQDGGRFIRKSPDERQYSNPGTSAVTRTLAVPVGVRVEAIIYGGLITNSAGSISYGLISDLSCTDLAVNTNNANIAVQGATDTAKSMLNIMTNASAQVRSRLSNSDVNISLVLSPSGWIYPRARSA